jgi:N-acetylmuramoyl-L-alanine amidase
MPIKLCNLALVVFLGLLLSAHRPAEAPPPARVRTVVIDPGHGGKDPGCLGKVSQEKDLALDLALETGALIKAHFPEVRVVYTRQTDVFVELAERAQIANRHNADLFISIHCNAALNPDMYGTETYVMGLHLTDENLGVAMRENASILQETNYQANYQGFNPNSQVSYILMANYQNAYQTNSLHFAQLVEDEFAVRQRRKSRGVKQSGFLVLWKTAMPSVLVEAGFLSNAQEEAYLNQPEGKAQVAASIYRAFRDYKAALESK